jgi:hypothetical protein
MAPPPVDTASCRNKRLANASVRSTPRNRKPVFESLEDRRVMASLPFGATPQDTGEFMLGRIAVTPVLLESTGAVSTEDWTETHVAEVMNNIQTGLQWWNQLLAKKSSVHTLEWVIDRTYVDNRLPTPFEPINMTSEGYLQWGPKFLQDIGYSQTNSLNFESSLRSFNHAQRLKLDTDWSFTIFVVNSARDADGSFAPGGNFSRAFAFAGGLFEVIPSKRPNSTYTHETGHIFWARDEYIGGGNYYDRRGYYDAQNTNAFDLNPNPNFVQQASIMSAGGSLTAAYSLVTSPDATLAQIGWRDSDNDGIFDLMDVPLKLEGTGRFFPQFGAYNFSGRASVQTLPNLNSSGTQNDITLNKVRRIEYRIDAGNWTQILATDDYTVNLNLQIPILPSQVGKTIEIRAVETKLGITSNVFSGVIGEAPDVTTAHGIQGFVWRDQNQNGQWNSNESGIPNATVTLVDINNQPLTLQTLIDPDQYPTGNLAGNLGPSNNSVRIDTIGKDSQALIGVYPLNNVSGPKFFKPYSFWARKYVDAFVGDQLQLRARFDQPQSFVSIEAVAVNDATRVRLDAYDANGILIARAEQSGLLRNQRVTLEVQTGSARIASVVARGLQASSVMLDHLRYGPQSQAVTASDGSYNLSNLPTGFYRLHVDPKLPGFQYTTSQNGIIEVNYSTSPVVQHVDFGGYTPPSPWQNTIIAEDVSGDQSVSPLDVLTLINDINTFSARSLEGSPAGVTPYLDVNGDRFISPLDVLMVINFLNRSGNAEGEQIAPMELNPSSQRSPLLPSFALDSPSPPSTRILYQSNFWNSAEQGPDRCGCPSCCAALASTALPSTSNGQSEAPEIPLHWKIDQALSTESLDSILNA